MQHLRVRTPDTLREVEVAPVLDGRAPRQAKRKKDNGDENAGSKNLAHGGEG